MRLHSMVSQCREYKRCDRPEIVYCEANKTVTVFSCNTTEVFFISLVATKTFVQNICRDSFIHQYYR